MGIFDSLSGRKRPSENPQDVIGKIKLNFLEEELSYSGISVLVDETDVQDLIQWWRHYIEQIDDSEYNVDFEWGMLDDSLPIEKLGLVFLWKKTWSDCDFETLSITGSFTIEEYTLEGVIEDCEINDFNSILVKDENDNYLNLDDKEEHHIKKYMDENSDFEYSYGIFQKEDWIKLNKDDLKNL